MAKMLYHATFGKNLKSIKEFGLGGIQKKNWEDSVKGVVCLANDAEVAADFCECAEKVCDSTYITGIVVLGIMVSDIDERKLKVDRNIRSSDKIFSYEYHGVIPASKLWVVKSDGVASNKVVGRLIDMKRVPRYYKL